MNLSFDQDLLRKYLLGSLPDTSMQEVDRRLLDDRQAAQELRYAEEDLIDDYVNEQLADDERLTFETRFLLNAERRSQLSFARALSKFDGSNQPRDTRTITDRSHLHDQHGTHRSYFTQASVVSIGLSVFVILVGVISYRLMRARSTSESALGPAVVLQLDPGLTRGSGTLQRISIPKDAKKIEFQLDLPASDFTSFRAEVLSDTGLVESMEQLTAQTIQTRKVLLLNSSSAPFTDGDYRIKLYGIAHDAQPTLIDSYAFRLTRN